MEPKKIMRLIGKNVKIWESDRKDNDSEPVEGNISDIWDEEWVVLTTEMGSLFYVQKSKIFFIEVEKK